MPKRKNDNYFGAYEKLVQQYRKISLAEERLLIASAQKGQNKSIEDIVLRSLGFVAFRIRREMLANAIPILLPEDPDL